MQAESSSLSVITARYHGVFNCVVSLVKALADDNPSSSIAFDMTIIVYTVGFAGQPNIRPDPGVLPPTTRTYAAAKRSFVRCTIGTYRA